jgi:hypothetical protein
MLMLELDDAVKVCMELLHKTTFFDDMPSEEYANMPEFIKGMFGQKCWIPPKADESAKQLNDLIFDINPAEICAQIEADNLRQWCEVIQANMKMALVQLPCWRVGELE